MSRPTPRVWALLAVVTVAIGVGTAVGVTEYRRAAAQDAAADPVAATDLASVSGVPHLVFRSTAPGDQYGLVALVPLDDPSGPRAFTDVECDRVAAGATATACLRTIRGVATRFEAELLDAQWQTTETWPLPGVPSRTRLSSDQTLLATTSFVTGHSYTTTGFTTQTIVHDLTSGDSFDIEEFTLVVDGEEVAPVDRNLWGVTFADDDTFYATAQSQSLGHTWLVRGSLSERTVETIQDGGACPSISPDGTRIGFKVQTSNDPVHWEIGILDLRDGSQRVLTGETRSFDDQIAWLDDDTVMYGLPRADEPGVTDVWSIDLAEDASPVLLVPQAWSPQVVGG
ncbi:hypothetical protein [Actinotalea sp.]|uniref:hypothetical protein n=1 Tax=Actinotalea sp. TaxID=1872145 RepID=UPI00356A37D7